MWLTMWVYVDAQVAVFCPSDMSRILPYRCLWKVQTYIS